MLIDILPLVISELIHTKGPDLTFLQIGAHDGVHYDHMYPYVKKYHWRGVLVEPQPKEFEKLVQNYRGEPQLKFVNAAVTHHGDPVTLYTFAENQGLPPHASMLASLDRNALVNNNHGYKGLIEAITVHSLTLGRLLDSYFIKGVDHIDILQIDTEGFDLEIIKMLANVDPIMFPTVINFEHAFYGGQELENCMKLLDSMGYRHSISDIGIDTVAYLQKDNFPIAQYT